MTTYVPSESAAAAIRADTLAFKADAAQDSNQTLIIIGQMRELLLMIEKNWGELALAIPGSIRNSQANQAAVLANISSSLMNLNDNAVKMTSAVSELSSSVKLMNTTLNQMATVQQVAVADQVSNNNFQQRETVAALKRNDIEPAPVPEFKKLIEEQIVNSTLMRATTAFTGAINDISNSIVQGAIDYISQTQIVTFGRNAIESLLLKLKVTGVVNKIANPEEIAIRASQNLTNSRAVTGLWTPNVLPPDP